MSHCHPNSCIASAKRREENRTAEQNRTEKMRQNTMHTGLTQNSNNNEKKIARDSIAPHCLTVITDGTTHTSQLTLVLISENGSQVVGTVKQDRETEQGHRKFYGNWARRKRTAKNIEKYNTAQYNRTEQNRTQTETHQKRIT